MGERKGWNVGDEKDCSYWKFNELYSKKSLKRNLFERSRTFLVLSRRFYKTPIVFVQVHFILKDMVKMRTYGRMDVNGKSS